MNESCETKVTIEGKMKFTKGEILSGYFWYTKFWVPAPPPHSNTSLGIDAQGAPWTPGCPAPPPCTYSTQGLNHGASG